MFFARFFSIGGCEVGLLDRNRIIIFQVIQAVTQLDHTWSPNVGLVTIRLLKGHVFTIPKTGHKELPGLSDSNKLVY